MSETTSEAFDVLAFRKERGWSQARLAAELGVNQSTVARMELGRAPSGPMLKLLRILAESTREAAE